MNFRPIQLNSNQELDFLRQCMNHENKYQTLAKFAPNKVYKRHHDTLALKESKSTFERLKPSSTIQKYIKEYKADQFERRKRDEEDQKKFGPLSSQRRMEMIPDSLSLISNKSKNNSINDIGTFSKNLSQLSKKSQINSQLSKHTQNKESKSQLGLKSILSQKSVPTNLTQSKSNLSSKNRTAEFPSSKSNISIRSTQSVQKSQIRDNNNHQDQGDMNTEIHSKYSTSKKSTSHSNKSQVKAASFKEELQLYMISQQDRNDNQYNLKSVLKNELYQKEGIAVLS